VSDPVQPFGGAFDGRHVLVTGHTGFKGAWLCAWLAELGAIPIGYALPPESPSLFEAIGLAGRMDHRLGDVRDRDAFRAALDETRPDVIVHMAAQALVRRSYADPAETFDTNVTGVVNLLDAVRTLRRPATVIVVTSDKCYEPLDPPRAHVEQDALGGRDPYSASKGAAEIVTASYRHSYFPPRRFDEHRVAVASVRAGNVIGGGDWAEDRIVPDIVRAIAAGRPVGLRNPGSVRPWQHVLDALSGYLWLAARLARDPDLAAGWNFGPAPGARVTVRELTERALAAWDRDGGWGGGGDGRGGGGWTDLSDPAAPPETAHLELSIDRAVSRLRWQPSWGAVEAIDATMAWYRAAGADVADNYDMTARQIAAYVEGARRGGGVWIGGRLS